MSDPHANERTMPAPPEGVTADEQLAAADERWKECPLRDCKRDPELLYSDFYLRDIRTNRLMCSACTTRTDAGYMAREVVRSHDDRFYQGTLSTDAILFGVMFAGSIFANLISMFVGFFYFAFIIGAAIGGGLASYARNLSKKQVSRNSHYFGIGGIVLGGILAPTVYIFMRVGILVFSLNAAFNFSILACCAGMIMASWSVFLRRI